MVTAVGGETVGQVSRGRGGVGSLLAVCGHRLNNGRKALDLGLAPGFHVVSLIPEVRCWPVTWRVVNKCGLSEKCGGGGSWKWSPGALHGALTEAP